MSANNQLLTEEEIDYIQNVVVKGFEEAIEESIKESERIAPWYHQVWDEMFGDRKPSCLAEGLAMATAARNEVYRREEAEGFDSL